MYPLLKQEWQLEKKGLSGANSFKKRFGGHGDFDKLT